MPGSMIAAVTLAAQMARTGPVERSPNGCGCGREAAKTAKSEPSTLIADNRKAFHDYHILETFEAGIALLGTEVKGIREGQANLRDSYARVDKGEVWLYNVHINPYSHRGYVDHDPQRKRRLLLHKYEIRKLIGKTVEKGLTLVPTRMYFKNGKVKVAHRAGPRQEGPRQARDDAQARGRSRDAGRREGARPPMRVLVVGAAGQLGQAMVARLLGRARGHPVHARATSTSPTTARRRARAPLGAPTRSSTAPRYNDVDGAEDDQVPALDVNAMARRARWRAPPRSVDAVLVHYSTDFVFSGTASTPYTESDRRSRRSVYAQSKLVGEWLAADAPPSLRGPRREPVRRPARAAAASIASSTRCARAARRRSFFDRVVSPSFVDDVAAASAHLLRARAARPALYHCVNSGHATWLDGGRGDCAAARPIGRRPLKPVSVNDVKLRAPRPQYAALSNEKLADGRLRDAGVAGRDWAATSSAPVRTH